MSVGFTHFLVLSVLLLAVGIFTVLTQRNAVRVLMGVEMILNAAALNFAAAARWGTSGLSGQVVSLFIIVLAAAESAVALAIVLAIYRHRREIDVTHFDELKG